MGQGNNARHGIGFRLIRKLQKRWYKMRRNLAGRYVSLRPTTAAAAAAAARRGDFLYEVLILRVLGPYTRPLLSLP